MKIGGSLGAAGNRLKERKEQIAGGAKAGAVIGAVTGQGALATALGGAAAGAAGLNVPGVSNPYANNVNPQQYQVDPNKEKTGQDALAARQGELRTLAQQSRDRQRYGMGLAGNDMRARQEALIAQLEAASRGEGPSAAQSQLQAATDQNMRQALAMAASSRGNPALAMQQANQARALASQQAANQSATLRAQEIMAAQGLLGQTLQGTRGLDLNKAQAELTGDIQQQQLSDALSQFYEGGINSNINSQLANALAYEQLKQGSFQDFESRRQANENAKMKRNTDMTNSIVGAFGDVAAAGMTGGASAAPKLAASRGTTPEGPMTENVPQKPIYDPNEELYA